MAKKNGKRRSALPTILAAGVLVLLMIQLLSLGVIGEYVGKIYNETKHRPRFVIERYLSESGDDPVVDYEK